MPQSGFDGKNNTFYPINDIDKNRIIAHDSPLNQYVGSEIKNIITDILLAKNQYLVNDPLWKNAEVLNSELNESEKRAQTFIDHLVVRNMDGSVITDRGEMEKWVNNTFYISFFDISSANSKIAFTSDSHVLLNVTRGLFDHLKSHDELVSIIAHELGHYFFNQKYPANTLPKTGKAFNERLADKHAMDCLFYMGKDPKIYYTALCHMFSRYPSDIKQNSFEHNENLALDPHGNYSVRLKNILDYIELKYGNFRDNLYKDPRQQFQQENSNLKFIKMHDTMHKLYGSSCYLSYIDDMLRQYTDIPTNNEGIPVNSKKLSYEQVIDYFDTLIQKKYVRLYAFNSQINEYIAHSNTDHLKFTPELENKVSRFLDNYASMLIYNYTIAHSYQILDIYQKDESYLDKTPKEQRNYLYLSDVIDDNRFKNKTSSQNSDIINDFILSHTDEAGNIVYNDKPVIVTTKYKILLRIFHSESIALNQDERDEMANILIKSPFNLIEKIPDAIAEIDRTVATLGCPKIMKTYKPDKNRENKEYNKEIADLLSEQELPHFTPPNILQKVTSQLQNIMDGKEENIINPYCLMLSKAFYNWPHYEMPSENEALGQTVPWLSALQKDNFINLKPLGITHKTIYSQFHGHPSNKSIPIDDMNSNEILSPVRFPDNKHYDIFTDENGKIISTGDNAKRMRENLFRKLNGLEETTLSDNFRNRLKIYNKLTEIYISKELPNSENSQKQLYDEIKQVPHFAAILSPFNDAYNYDKYKNENFDTYKSVRTIDNYLYNTSYSQMPHNSPLIDEDFKLLQDSIYFQTFNLELPNFKTPQEKLNYMSDMPTMAHNSGSYKIYQALTPIIDDLFNQLPQTKVNAFYKENLSAGHHSRLMKLTNINPATQDDAQTQIKLISDLDKDKLDPRLSYPASLLCKSYFPYSIGTPKDEYVTLYERSEYYEKLRECYHFIPTENQPENVIRNLQAKFEAEECAYGFINLNKVQNFFVKNEYKLVQYEITRYINNPKNTEPLPAVELSQSIPYFKKSYKLLFTDKLNDYIINRSDFKNLDFKSQYEVYRNLCHKDLLNSNSNVKLHYQISLLKSYKKLLPEEKKDIAWQLISDNKLEHYCDYDNKNKKYISSESTVTLIDYPVCLNYFINETAFQIAKSLGTEPTNRNSAEHKMFTDGIDKSLKSIRSHIHNPMTAHLLLKKIAEKTEIQSDLVYKFMIADKILDTRRNLSIPKDDNLRLFNLVNTYLVYYPEANSDFLRFLNQPPTKENIKIFKKKLYQNKKLNVFLPLYSDESLFIAHKKIWNAPLPHRALIMKRLLENNTQNDTTQIIDLVADKYINPKSPRSKEFKKILNTLFATKPEYSYQEGYYRTEQISYKLAGMLSAQPPAEKNKSVDLSLGEALYSFCSQAGTAWIKFGQALSNFRNLDADIRNNVAKLKSFNPDKPRWETLFWISQNLAPNDQDEIKKVGKIIGSGSLYTTIDVTKQDDAHSVIQISNQKDIMQSKEDFKIMLRTADDLARDNPEYNIFKNLIVRVAQMNDKETRISTGFNQYIAASKNYNQVQNLRVNDIPFEIKVLPWFKFEQLPEGGYKEVKKAVGQPLAKVKATPQEKHDLAAGYIATELGILLGGNAWDIDRHSQQQTFLLKRDTNSHIKKVYIEIFDTGAVRPAPNSNEKAAVGNFLADVAINVMHGMPMTQALYEENKKLQAETDTKTYIMDVSRGCLALSDMGEYIKETKDNNGQILTHAETLQTKDWINIFESVLKSGLADHEIIDPMMEKIMKNTSSKENDNNTIDFSNNDSANLILESKSLLKIKKENRRIDKYNIPGEYVKGHSMNKQRRLQHNKKYAFPRLLQAYYLKHNRNKD